MEMACTRGSERRAVGRGGIVRCENEGNSNADDGFVLDGGNLNTNFRQSEELKRRLTKKIKLGHCTR